VAAPDQQRHNRGKHTKNARESHPPMLSWHRSAPTPRLVAQRSTGRDLAFCVFC
jgi:hypothetical protein